MRLDNRGKGRRGLISLYPTSPYLPHLSLSPLSVLYHTHLLTYFSYNLQKSSIPQIFYFEKLPAMLCRGPACLQQKLLPSPPQEALKRRHHTHCRTNPSGTPKTYPKTRKLSTTGQGLPGDVLPALIK